MATFDAVRFSVAVQMKRKMCNLSTKELGEITSLSSATISRIEQEEYAPEMVTFLRLCDWLDLEPQQFFKKVKK